jgi:hypothetical protein
LPFGLFLSVQDEDYVQFLEQVLLLLLLLLLLLMLLLLFPFCDFSAVEAGAQDATLCRAAGCCPQCWPP